MNQFSSLDAQNETASLAMVTTEETIDAPSIPASRSINHAKLLKHNLHQPIANRINSFDLETKRAFAYVRGNLAALRAQVESEIAPTLNQSRDTFDSLMAM